MPREVRIGPAVVGSPSVPVVGRLRTPDDPGRSPAPQEFTRVRERWPGPLVVQPARGVDLSTLPPFADGLCVTTTCAEDVQFVSGAGRLGLPVLVRRDPAATVEEWLTAAERFASAGAAGVVLCEGGARHGDSASVELALVAEARARTQWPVAVDPGTTHGLATAAVAGGADALVLDVDAATPATEHAAGSAAALAPLVRPVRPHSLDSARAAMDQVDACLAVLLERRAGLVAEIQDLKPVSGFAGRDPARERAIVESMARRAPRLGISRLQTIMARVIEAGLDLVEAERGRSTRDGGTSPSAADAASPDHETTGDSPPGSSTNGRHVLRESVGGAG
ncbi:MAG: chorismate mutase [Streptosporangiaceae bacterium]